MLEKHLRANTMIEVLIHGDLALPDDAEIICFSDADSKIAQEVLSKLGALWNVTAVEAPGPYPRKNEHVEAVRTFINQSLADPNWRGNGLEFDRL